MTVETGRLVLLPLTAEQLELLCTDLPRMEEQMNLTYDGEDLTGFMGEIFKSQIEIVKQCPETILYHTFWMFMDRQTRVILGSGSFKYEPNGQGETEIGYGLNERYWNKGFATEAVRGMTDWALSQPELRAVVAETEKWNLASQRVLQKCGYAEDKSKETEECFWWRKTR